MTPREIAKLTLYLSSRTPYDAPDNFWACEGSPPPPATDWAHAAARGVMHDLGDRRGIKWHTENVAEDVRAELVQSLAEIIRAASDQEVDRLRAVLTVIWDTYQSHDPTRATAGTLAYIAKDGLADAAEAKP